MFDVDSVFAEASSDLSSVDLTLLGGFCEVGLFGCFT